MGLQKTERVLEPNQALKEVEDAKAVDVTQESGDSVSHPPMISFVRYEEILRVSKEKVAILASYAKQLEEQLRNILPIIGDQPQEEDNAADSANKGKDDEIR